MEYSHVQNFEQQIRDAVEIGNPWALDELIQEVCGQSNELRGVVMQIVTDEYRQRLRNMPRNEILRLYKEFYAEQEDSNRDWLLGEVVEEIIREN
jgi:hypothetical protein